MAMKAGFELEFSSEAEAKKAFAVLKKDLRTIKGTLKTKLDGKRIFATVESASFAGLRALSTSFLRSARIAYDVLDSVAGRKRQDAAEEDNCV
jgi:tRNA threonylcarbamoyladenosine modification (KEOPS) complex  Pcc1 subunit